MVHLRRLLNRIFAHRCRRTPRRRSLEARMAVVLAQDS